MDNLVCEGATLRCSGSPTGMTTLKVTSQHVFQINKLKVATMNDFMPHVNIPSFGMCHSPTNPMVQAAQGAPQPCVPNIFKPWSPTSSAVSTNQILSAIQKSSCTSCMWAGVIRIEDANNRIVEAR
jgi:hypothetical protein